MWIYFYWTDLKQTNKGNYAVPLYFHCTKVKLKQLAQILQYLKMLKLLITLLMLVYIICKYKRTLLVHILTFKNQLIESAVIHIKDPPLKIHNLKQKSNMLS